MLFIGASLASILGLIYPVQRELDTSMYSRATYATVLNGIFPAEEEHRISDALASPTCLVSSWTTAVGSSSSAPQLTNLQVTGPDCAAGATPFPSSATVRSLPRSAGDDWIDISADLAQTLRVSAGDKVSVEVGPEMPAVSLTVRAISAVREPGWQFVAVAPGARLMHLLPPDAQKYGTVLTSAGDREALKALENNPVAAKLKTTKFYPPKAYAVADLLADADERSMNSLGLVRTIGVLAIIAVSLLIVREMHVFRARSKELLSLVHALGGSAAVATGAIHVFVVVEGSLVLAGALVLAWVGFATGFFACCFPMALNTVLVSIYVGLVLILAVAGATSYATLVRKWR